MSEPQSTTTMADVAEALLPGGTKGCSADDCKELGNKMLQAGKVCLDSVLVFLNSACFPCASRCIA